MLSSITSRKIIFALKEIFSRLGLPEVIVSDNGRQLVSKEISEFFEGCGIQHHKCAAYTPSQNGLVERFNRVISERLNECEKFGWGEESALVEMLFSYRVTPHSTTEISPFEAMYNRKARDMLSRLRPAIREDEIPQDSERINRKKVKEKVKRMKERFDQKARTNLPCISPGDRVTIKGPDGRFKKYQKVADVGRTSVILENGQKWPMSRVGTKIKKTPAN